ncbi:MAG: DUF420 domain-containing protein [Helicobacteraceae bacterium]|nr:DUF420 domain-containing protein [Helicobacteraceae bacterium]
MFETGFFSTRAPLFMDVVTIYFALLPFLLGISIYFAAKGKLKLHMQSQLAIFIFTMMMIVVFEVGVRVIGGFKEFLEHSSVSQSYFVIYLIIHVMIAIASVVGWVWLIFKSHHAFKTNGFKDEFFKIHPPAGKLVFIGLTLTAYSGVGMYYMLFVLVR